MALSPRRTVLIYVALWLGDGVKPEARGVYCAGCVGSRVAGLSYLSNSSSCPISSWPFLLQRRVRSCEQRCTAAIVGRFTHIRFQLPRRIRSRRHIER